MRDVIIIGTGPSGLTAAIYAARANLKPLIIEGYQPGGQLTTTTEVENFPGFKEGIMGPELMEEMRAQAERFGAEFISGEATKVELTDNSKVVWVDDEKHEAKTVIVSTGASANLMGLDSEKEYMGKGVSTCATCDGFFFRDKVICVVGGGDSAMEEANYLTKFASKVYLIHRREEFRASKIMVEKVKANDKVEMVLNSTVEDIYGEPFVEGIKIKNKISGETSDLKLDGVFVAIGHTPNTALFKDQLNLDENGYIITSSDKTTMSHTNIEGVYACGDVQDHRYQQAITAAGSGCVAALDAEHYIENHG